MIHKLPVLIETRAREAVAAAMQGIDPKMVKAFQDLNVELHKRTPCERRRYLRRHVPDGADPVAWVRMMLEVK